MRLWLAGGAGVAVLAGVGALALDDGAAPAAATRAAAGRQAAQTPAPKDVESYWSAKRMAAATPAGGRPSQDQPEVRAKVARLTAQPYAGIPTVGALFFNNGRGDHYCTASVVVSRTMNLLITAAHCIHGGRGRGYFQRVAFVPQYDRGRRPFGVWTAKGLFVDRRWAIGSDPDLDFGYVALHRRNGRRIQGVVGGNRLAVNKGYVNTVTVTGYPNVRFDPRDRPVQCRVRTARQASFQIRMTCNGFHGGTSGSPWLLNYNSTTRTGHVNGVVGGHNGGGTVHWISFSPYFDQDVNRLRTYADQRSAG